MAKLSKVKKLMLDMLASGEPVSASDLLKASGQAEYARRLRELRDEGGYDLVSYHDGETVVWKLQSKKIKESKKRTYLGAKAKNKMLLDHRSCVLCGKKFSKDRKSVFDHKVPLIKGGNGEEENFQPVCVLCNNLKRAECKGCSLECQTCFLAFPEKFESPLILKNFNGELFKKLKSYAKRYKLTKEDYAKKLLEEAIRKVVS